MLTFQVLQDALAGHIVAAGTGHRPQDIPGFSALGFPALVETAKAAIQQSGATAVVAGGAIGWDQALAQAALELHLPLVLALPFPGQENRWRPDDQARYAAQLTQASAAVYFHDVAPTTQDELLIAMNGRNAVMVDAADVVLAFWSGKARGGTANAVAYAKRIGRPIQNAWNHLWSCKPPADLPKTLIDIRIQTTKTGFQVTLTHGPHQKNIEETLVCRNDQLFLTAMLTAVRALKRADYLRFNLSGDQVLQIRQLQEESARDFLEAQVGSSQVDRPRVRLALLKEELIAALGQYPHNLGTFGRRPVASISGFQGDYRFLSNFWTSPVLLDDVQYGSVEAAFQAAKTTDPSQRQVFQTADPATAKRLGKLLKLRPDWNDLRLDVMRDLLEQKFAPGSALAKQLKATGRKPLIEANTWGDTFWGVSKGVGSNHLGQLLEEIRAML